MKDGTDYIKYRTGKFNPTRATDMKCIEAVKWMHWKQTNFKIMQVTCKDLSIAYSHKFGNVFQR